MLSIVPTPIGNLADITLRALEVLKQADLILCEDTRRTLTLLRHYEIGKPLLSYHEHSSDRRAEEILKLLKEDKRVALVSDGGMPVISDPGFEIVHAALKEKLPFEVLPGPSAVTTALVMSGLPVDSFGFYGFLSNKGAKRKNELKALEDHEETLIFFESPFRVLKALQDMLEVLGDREAAVAREISKKFEEVLRGNLSELIAEMTRKERPGEMVVLVAGKGRKRIFEKGDSATLNAQTTT
ncbi:MAG TPA: 16S rRNA (cytidine(1402)-2'-O)-methyltransferase [Candidatus Omnitrophota bacterium]|nr:16S rRNA (cytidine(1402)-2'-O)-methyltransferase [Candidatus Omnitrophota bacterium]HPS36154.1 16S rRNA (cytidine(1402)-2'-O)-methyltransferase [Candidatus Omnitrophota bacterium]